MLKVSRILMLAIACVGAPAYGQLTKPGPSLNMLQQIQGSWRSDCLAVATGARYQQTKLVVSFTHFTFTLDEFSEPDCRVSRSTAKSRYRFVLRDPLTTPSNIDVFAIDFLAEDVPSGSSALYPLNIIQYESGTLRLGAPPLLEVEERLQRLDRELVFSR